MARALLTEQMWQQIRPHLPARPKKASGGRPPISDRLALTGIIFILKSGINWKELPCEMGCGSGMTCLRRLRFWQQTGAWKRIRQTLQHPDFGLDNLDWERTEKDWIPQKQHPLCLNNGNSKNNRRIKEHTQVGCVSVIKNHQAEVIRS